VQRGAFAEPGTNVSVFFHNPRCGRRRPVSVKRHSCIQHNESSLEGRGGHPRGGALHQQPTRNQ
jgi:hypothetical protein